MRIILIILFCTPTITLCQEIAVDTVSLTETVDKKYVSKIPKVRALTTANSYAARKINNAILERFDIKSFNQNELDEFRWYDVGFTSEIESNLLYIGFAGEYYGAYPNYIEDESYFDTTTGELLDLTVIPFQALFNLSGYLDFMNKYWLTDVKKAFKEAIECADYEPYCSYYDIYSYSTSKNKLSISLADDCYARVSRACSPGHSIQVPLDSIKPYLNKIGKQVLIETDYMAKSHIQKFKENLRLKPTIPNTLFLFGKIDNKFSISMAIEVTSENKISGFYYYDNKRIKIDLKGSVTGERMAITETVNGKTTGSFELTINQDYDANAFPIYGPNADSKYLAAKWFNADRTKVFNIAFSEVKLSDRN